MFCKMVAIGVEIKTLYFAPMLHAIAYGLSIHMFRGSLVMAISLLTTIYNPKWPSVSKMESEEVSDSLLGSISHFVITNAIVILLA